MMMIPDDECLFSAAFWREMIVEAGDGVLIEFPTSSSGLWSIAVPLEYSAQDLVGLQVRQRTFMVLSAEHYFAKRAYSF